LDEWASLVVRSSDRKVTSLKKKYCFWARDTLAKHAKEALKSGSALDFPIGQGLESGKKEKHGKHWSNHNPTPEQTWQKPILSAKNNMDVFSSLIL
jgi:hypothetical protein